MENTDFYILLAVAAVLGVLRFKLPVKGEIVKGDVYKDLAHVFVGFAFGYAAYAWSSLTLWAIPIGLTVLEVVAFVIRRKK